MIRSMTAYGRFSHRFEGGELLVEIHSVNKKGLEYTLLLPREFLLFDCEVRKWLSAVLQRGQVTVRVFFNRGDRGIGQKQVEILQRLKKDFNELSTHLGFPSKEISFSFLYTEGKELLSRSSFSPEEEQEFRKALQIAIDGALAACLKVKEAEGRALKLVFEKHLMMLDSLVKKVELGTAQVEEKYRKKLESRLTCLKTLTQEDQDRILREICLYADKVDVMEEIARIHSHIQQFHGLLESTESVGRMMDFLLQELGREVGTLAAKAESLDIAYDTLKMKGELEKIREQAQNIE